jgi:hypothetical protein
VIFSCDTAYTDQCNFLLALRYIRPLRITTYAP